MAERISSWKLIWVCLLTAVLIVPATVLRAQAPAGATLAEAAGAASLDELVPPSSEVTIGQLANGLRYFIRENREPVNRAELRLVVNVGSVLEDDDQLGLAHVLEHMAFNGTERFEKHELVAFMESIGMRFGPGINASTSFDETIFMLRLPTDKPENIETAFRIMEDWARGLTLDPAEIDQERGVVIEEWRGSRGAGSRVQDQQTPVIFAGSQYAERLPIGTPESIETFDYSSLERFYRDWYRPELMAVVAVGDFDSAEIETLVQQHFEPLENPENARDRISHSVPDHDGTLFSIVADPELTSTTVVVLHKMDYQQDRTVGGARQRIAEQLYNGMLNQRFQELSRESDPPFLIGISGNGRLTRSTGIYQLQALVPEDGIDRGLEVLLQESERVARFGFTESELERARISVMRQQEAQYTNRANRNSSGFASQYINAFLRDTPIPGIEYSYALYQRFVPEITLDEVNRIGQNWVRDTNRVVMISGPEKEELSYPGEAELLALLSAAAGADVVAYVDSASDAELLAEIPEGSGIVASRTRDGGITEWDLANGVLVVLRPTNFDDDQVVFRAFSPGGISLATDEQLVPARTALRVINPGGLGDFNANDLQKVLTGKRAAASASISEFEEGLNGQASPQDLETMFQLIYLRFVAPRADPNAFDVFETQAEIFLGNRDQNPLTPFNDTYNRIMSQDHPRRRPETLEMLREGADLEQSLAFYQDRFADASDFTFVFVGTFDLETMRPFVETYLGALPSIDRDETWRDVGVRPPAGVFEETVYAGLEPRGQTRIVFTGPFDFDDTAERVRIAAVDQVVETRLQDLLREDLGGTYSVSVSQNNTWRPDEQYTISLSFGSDPERGDELAATVFEEIERLKTEGPTESEVADTIEAMLRSHETNLEQNLFWMFRLTESYQREVNEGLDAMFGYPDEVRRLTTGSIQDGIRQYFDTDNYVRVTLMPEQ